MTTAPERSRLAWVDTGKAVSILLVVFYHSSVLMASAGYDIPVLLQVNSALADLRMPTFFLLSGLFAGKWVAAGWRHLLEGKLLLFIWVYLLWTVLQVPGKLASMAFFTHEIGSGTAVQTLGSLILSPLRTSGIIWFIWALAVFFVIAKATSRLPVAVPLVVSAVSAVLIRWLPNAQENALEDLVGRGIIGGLSYYVFFLVGMHFAKPIRRFASELRTWQALLLILGAVLLWLATIQLHLASVGPVRFLLSLAGLGAGLALATLLQRVPGATWLGARTLPVYLPNFMVLIALVVGVRSIVDLASPIVVPLVAVLAVVTVVLCFVLYRFRRVPVVGALYSPPASVIRLVSRVLDARGTAPRTRVAREGSIS